MAYIIYDTQIKKWVGHKNYEDSFERAAEFLTFRQVMDKLKLQENSQDKDFIRRFILYKEMPL